jgi:hypothetical protein
MLELGSYEYEECRYEFVESRRLNKEHAMQRKLWNGISEGMWESEEWYNFCRNKLGEETLLKYHTNSNRSTLEEFF